jgi:quinol-cytochrome oxidoreductase complex cytochrome b subunit
MKRHGLKILFWLAVCLMVASLLLTIIGSSINRDAVLNAGIISWLVTTSLFFFWLVLWIWSKTKKYKKRPSA